MFVALKRIFHWGWLSFKRQRGIAIATVFIFAMTLSLLSFLLLFQETTRFLTQALEKRIDVSVYFKEEALEEEIFKLKDVLSKVSEVKKVEFISKEQAFSEFSRRHKDNSAIMESLRELGTNPFLASLNIQTAQPEHYTKITKDLQDSAFSGIISKIDFYDRKPVIERLNSIVLSINSVGIVLAILLVIGAVAIIFNQIRGSIYSSKEEIEVMRLVGASNWFIRGPFLAQAIIAGLFAVLITTATFGLSLYFLAPKLEVLLPGLDLFNYFISNIGFIILVEFLAAIVLSVLSAIVATRTYLKV